MERKVINRKHFSFWSLKNRTFSVLSPSACFQCVDTRLQRNMPKACPYAMALSFWEIDTTSFQEIILSSGFFRRETASGFYTWSKKNGNDTSCPCDYLVMIEKIP